MQYDMSAGTDSWSVGYIRLILRSRRLLHNTRHALTQDETYIRRILRSRRLLHNVRHVLTQDETGDAYDDANITTTGPQLNTSPPQKNLPHI
jgi:hypothetical protein